MWSLLGGGGGGGGGGIGMSKEVVKKKGYGLCGRILVVDGTLEGIVETGSGGVRHILVIMVLGC